MFLFPRILGNFNTLHCLVCCPPRKIRFQNQTLELASLYLQLKEFDIKKVLPYCCTNIQCFLFARTGEKRDGQVGRYCFSTRNIRKYANFFPIVSANHYFPGQCRKFKNTYFPESFSALDPLDLGLLYLSHLCTKSYGYI